MSESNTELVVWADGHHRVIRDRYCYQIQEECETKSGPNAGKMTWRHRGYYGTLVGLAKGLLKRDIGFDLTHDWHEYTRLLDAAAERVAAGWQK